MSLKKLVNGKNRGKSVSSSGRVYTPEQVEVYHATNNFKSKETPAKKGTKRHA